MSYKIFVQKENTGMEFGILVLPKGKRYKLLDQQREITVVLLSGKGIFRSIGTISKVKRNDVFKQEPFIMSAPKDCLAEVIAQSKMELAVIKVKNPQNFKPRIFKSKEVKREWRGKGVMNETALRLVRTVFDKNNHPKSNLVLGEVLHKPGRWSSYPPHYHSQPEIYYYRFWPNNGYGLAQLGERVIKVKNNDLVEIVNSVNHPQVAAPGYQMWYLWVIRHLPKNPYQGFIYDKKHKWLTK